MPVTHKVSLSATIKGISRIEAVLTVEFYRKNYRNFVLGVAIVVLGAVVGTAIGFVNPLLGIFAGIVLGLAGLWVPPWKERHQRIERARNRE